MKPSKHDEIDSSKKHGRIAGWVMKKFGDWLLKEQKPRRTYLCDFNRIRFEVRTADVLLIEGRNRVSNVIKQITTSPWSHAALYIGRISEIEDQNIRRLIKRYARNFGNKQLVIESQLGSGTIVSPMDRYKDDHIRICRPVGLAQDDAQRVVNFASKRLGRQYSIRHILDLLRFLFPWGFWPRRYRSSLFSQNALKPTEEICSSMLAEAYASVKFPILPLVKPVEDDDDEARQDYELIRRNPRLFTPSDFDYSPYFDIIKYPIFNLGGAPAYRNLPWAEDSFSNDDGTVTKPVKNEKQKE